MVSFSVIKIVYVLGFIGITIAGIASIIQGIDQRFGGEILILTGLGTILIGNLLWRVLCEAWIIIFSIHGELISIRDILKSTNVRTSGNYERPLKSENINYPEETSV
ncbi:MAG: hypothetical protein Kow0042_31230 [Calditrichia bacterium]